MRSCSFPKKIIGFLGSLMVILLSACNMPGKAGLPTGLDVTQVYQTVQAQLTQTLAVEIEFTPSPSAQEELPTATQGNTVTADTVSPSQTATSQTRCDQAAAGYPKIDITIEDDTELAPGEKFTKTWRLTNVGTCAWSPDYEIVFFSGEQMGAVTSQPLNTHVGTNQSIDLSIDMQAPLIPGTYQGNWKIRNADGLLFGIGPNGESPFWVRVKVVQVLTSTPTATITPSATLTPTPTTAVQVEGPVTLVISDTLDLDNLLVNAGGVDLVYQVAGSNPPQHQLVPLEELTLGFYGGLQPKFQDCQSTALAATPITLNELALGSYLCYHTGLGLFGWMRLDQFDPDVGEVKLQILTWEAP
jgi:hypothetical protein